MTGDIMAEFDFQFPAGNGDVPPRAFDAESILLSAMKDDAKPHTNASENHGAGPEVRTAPVVEEVGAKRRGRPRKQDKQNEQVAAAMANFFSPEGIGVLWVNAWNGFYAVCGAEKLAAEQESFHATVFANWAKHRLPQTPEKYQPDMMLLASIAMMNLPRMAPIAKTTAPIWKRFGSWISERARKISGAFRKTA
jgi:hypothetical protein